jgi:hypothetical protein
VPYPTIPLEDRLLRLVVNLPKRDIEAIRVMALQEQRSTSQMARILIQEALKARS